MSGGETAAVQGIAQVFHNLGSSGETGETVVSQSFVESTQLAQCLRGGALCDVPCEKGASISFDRGDLPERRPTVLGRPLEAGESTEFSQSLELVTP